MSEHTPGPWRVMDNCPYVAMADGPVFGVVTFDVETSEETYYANARLIAATPDLLAACKAAVANGSAPDGGGILIRMQDYFALLAAIARATGGQP